MRASLTCSSVSVTPPVTSEISWDSPAVDLDPIFIMANDSRANSQGAAAARMSRRQVESGSRSASHDRRAGAEPPAEPKRIRLRTIPLGLSPRRRGRSGDSDSILAKWAVFAVSSITRPRPIPAASRSRHARQGELAVQFPLQFSGIAADPRRQFSGQCGDTTGTRTVLSVKPVVHGGPRHPRPC